jgi:small subunit ribosomal protein S1
MERWQAEGKDFVAPVIGCNKGGLLVRVCDGLGFVPASQLAELPCSLGTADLRSDLAKMVGQNKTLRLIEVDRERDRVICSERATRWHGDGADERLLALRDCIGETIEGTVRSICEFGVFVELGGVDGLIHISELSWQRIRHPSDLVSVDQHLRVIILNVDMEGRRVGLSLKRLAEDPWEAIAARHSVGDLVEVEITNIVEFGVFAQVSEGVEGLVHISEISDEPFSSPHEVIAEGQRMLARILHVDAKARRLGLSIRQV